ncbi:hypothetical protein V5J35_004065 [Endozoicomonas sp. NE40]|uniref:Transposase DDE domain-containing protein n=1 Tax=Endozoicomonas lisbonensis TaxID=3120522 RepID=A0ABV2SM76_9GAMM
MSDASGHLGVKPLAGKMNKSVGNQAADIKQLRCRAILNRQSSPVVAVAAVNICQRYTPSLTYLPGHSMKDHPGCLIKIVFGICVFDVIMPVQVRSQQLLRNYYFCEWEFLH